MYVHDDESPDPEGERGISSRHCGHSGGLSDQPITTPWQVPKPASVDARNAAPGSILVSNAVESPWLSTGARLIGLRD